MRIVAGSARGRKLAAPDGPDTRPTSDRVREAMFNALYSLDDVVADATVLDLFAGTGALGLEALSRGAAHAVFVERNPRALRALEQNIDSTGTDRTAVTVVRADAVHPVCVHPSSLPGARPAISRRVFGLVTGE